MINWRLYAYIAGAVLFLVAIGGAYLQGRSDGGDITRAEYQARDLQAATEAQIAYAGIVERNRKKEAEWQKSLTAVSKNYQQRIAANETQRLADLAALDARTLVLRDPNANSQACGSAGSPAPGTAAGRDGAEGSELPAATSRFLLGEASRADLIVAQLTACQAILQEERR